MKPDLSIVIPVYNRPAELSYIVRRLQTMVCLSGKTCQVEIIVVDDGSTPRLQEETLGGAILLRHERSQGAPLARKRGAERASGRYIHFHDSDDDVSDMWLDRILSHIATSEFDLLFTARVVRDVTDHAGDFREPVALQSMLKSPLALRNYLSYENCIGPLGAVTFSRSAVGRMTFPPIASCQDWHMYWEALHERSVLVYDSRVWHIYDTSGNDRISSSPERKRSGIEAVARLMCQSPTKRFLVSHFLKFGYDLRTSGGVGPILRALYSFIRAGMILLARHPLLDSALFGPAGPK